MRARSALALVVACALGPACGRGEADTVAPEAAPSPSAPGAASASPEVAPAVRRPSRRYSMSRDGDRCTVGFTDGDRASTPLEVPCPGQLASGERIRLAGKACLRESPDPTRELPVLCPDHLLVLERAERDKANGVPAAP